MVPSTGGHGHLVLSWPELTSYVSRCGGDGRAGAGSVAGSTISFGS